MLAAVNGYYNGEHIFPEEKVYLTIGIRQRVLKLWLNASVKITMG